MQTKSGTLVKILGQELEELIRETNVDEYGLINCEECKDDDSKVIGSAVVGLGAMSGSRRDVQCA